MGSVFTRTQSFTLKVVLLLCTLQVENTVCDCVFRVNQCIYAPVCSTMHPGTHALFQSFSYSSQPLRTEKQSFPIDELMQCMASAWVALYKLTTSADPRADTRIIKKRGGGGGGGGARKGSRGCAPGKIFAPGFDTIFTPLIYFGKLCSTTNTVQII